MGIRLEGRRTVISIRGMIRAEGGGVRMYDRMSDGDGADSPDVFVSGAVVGADGITVSWRVRK